jgi:hypothetical protein
VSPEQVRAWLSCHQRSVLLLCILAIAGVAHGVNMLGCPQYNHDEGVFMARAWSFFHHGIFHPYGFTYDQTPLGYVQLGGWAILVGGYNTFGTAVDTGRVYLLVLQVLSTWCVYGIAWRISGKSIIGAQAALLFALSPFGIYEHRPILLDNIATFWMLLSLRLLFVERLSALWLTLSAFALGVSILSKVPTIAMIPALAYLVSSRVGETTPERPAGLVSSIAGVIARSRLVATTLWTVLVASVASLYAVYALLRGELLPRPGQESLLGGLQWQASRGRDAGIFDPGSSFWHNVAEWGQAEPVLVVAGSLGALLCIVAIRRHQAAAAIGLGVVSFAALFARGGVVEAYYLIPVLPLLAISLALGCDILVAQVEADGSTSRVGALLRSHSLRYGLARLWWAAIVLAGLRGPGLAIVRIALLLTGRTVVLAMRTRQREQSATERAPGIEPRVILAAISVATMIALGCTSAGFGFARQPLLLWQDQQTAAQRAAIDWVREHVPTTATLAVEPFVWTDLHDGERGGRVWPNAHLHIPVEHNRRLREVILQSDWRSIDYIVGGRRVIDFAIRAPHPRFVEEILLAEALKHSSVAAAFDNGVYPVWVFQVHYGREPTRSRAPAGT